PPLHYLQPRRNQIIVHFDEPSIKPVQFRAAIILLPQINPKRRRHSNRRGAANDKVADRMPHLLFVADLNINLLEWKLGLVEQLEALSIPGDGLQHCSS